MKRILIYLSMVVLAGCSVLGLTSSRRDKEKLKLHFKVEDSMVYFHDKPIAKYQAKTYSLDGGELVEEYNLLLVDHTVENQTIGDLIDYISDRHQGAEVEIEIEPDGVKFKL